MSGPHLIANFLAALLQKEHRIIFPNILGSRKKIPTEGHSKSHGERSGRVFRHSQTTEAA